MKSPADLNQAFAELIETAFAEAPPTGLCGLELMHPQLHTPILIPFARKDQLSMDKTLDTVAAVIQSNQNVEVTTMNVKAMVVDPPVASGLPHPANVDKYIKKHSGANGLFFDSKRTDKRCLIRAVVLGIARAHQHNDYKAKCRWNAMRHAKSAVQNRETMALIQKLGLPHDGPYGLEHLKTIGKHFEGRYQIKAWQLEMAMGLIFESPSAPITIHILISKEHAYLINTINGFFSTSYFCEGCNRGVRHLTEHKCEHFCR